MKTNAPLIIAALAATLLLSLTPTSAAQPIASDCTNFGNQLNIGSHYLCAGQGGCTNYGIIANVGSQYECGGGPCSNEGILVNVGSKYCGADKNLEVCEGTTCLEVPPSSNPSSPSQPARPPVNPVASNCIPQVKLGDFGTISITCDGTPTPCGVAKSPLCWGVRYLCEGGLKVVLETYDGIRNSPESSECETQPGASPNSNTSANLPPVDQGCYYTVGNCTGGNCTFNFVGVCSLHGSCWLNTAGACDGGSCVLNVASVCSESCTAKVMGTCINRPAVVELPGPHAFPNGPDASPNKENVLAKAPVAT